MSAIKMFRLDFLSIKVYIKSYIFFLVYPFIFSSMGAVGVGAFCGLMFTLLSGTVFSLQEKNRMERLYSVVAISENSVVRGRYLFLAAHILTVCLLIIPIAIISGRARGNGAGPGEAIFAMGLAFMLFWLVSGFQTPLFFRYGYTKMRFVTYAPILLISLGPYIIFNFFTTAETREKISESITRITSGVSNTEFAVIFFALGIIFMLISYIFAVGCYRKAKG